MALEHTVAAIPGRNRAIKKLLQQIYPHVKISVRAGRGTAYHWVHIEFLSMPAELLPFKNGMLRSIHVESAIEAAGIYIHTFVSDGDYHGKCIEVMVRGTKHND